MFGLTAIECFVAIIFIFIIIYWLTPEKIIWIPMMITALLFAVLAFNVQPNDSDDLSRYFVQLGYFREYGHDYLQHCFDTSFNNWDTYRVCAYYLYFFRRFDNNNWLPAVTIGIVYGLMLLVLYKASVRFKVNKKYLFFGTLFFLSTYWFYDTYSGIRNGLTFAVIFACAYYHLVERKRIPLCYLGYFLACLTHSAGIMLVTLVILTELTLNNSGKFMNFMLIFGLIFGGIIMQYLDKKIDNKYVHFIAGQAEKHQAGETLELGTMFLVNVTFFVFISILVIYFSTIILESEYSDELKRFYKFSSIVLYFLVGCLYSGLIFVRFARWILPIIGGLFITIGYQLLANAGKKYEKRFLLYYAPIEISGRYKLKPVLTVALFGYTAVYFWYLCNGSSLHWLHF